MSTPIVKFYVDGKADLLGRTHDDMMQFTEERMEECHDYIQWLFPTAEKSVYAMVFPVLSDKDVKTLQDSPEAHTRILAALAKFRVFYGLTNDHDGNRTFDREKWQWCRDGDHNLLRVTRIIRSLRLFGEEGAANDFAEDAVAAAKECDLDGSTLRYWERAISEHPMKSLRN